MSDDDRTRFAITVLLSGMVNSVLFGAGLIVILLTPALAGSTAAAASQTIAVLVAASLIVSPLIAWAIAPRLRARHWRGRRTDFMAG